MLLENVYVYNPNRCQHTYGSRTFYPGLFAVVSVDEAAAIRIAQLPLSIEGDTDFPAIWATCVPKRQV